MVSGLADGIDAAAHQGALEVNGLTVAVLAHGLDTVKPSKNKVLADAILKNNGALVSEYPWGTKTNRSYFVARDRIQSGLSLGVFVVETGVKGGTMHTVRFCKEQKRILILLQHPPDLIGHPKTLGNAQLLSEGNAVVFENEDDIDLVKIEMDQIKNKDKSGRFNSPAGSFKTVDSRNDINYKGQDIAKTSTRCNLGKLRELLSLPITTVNGRFNELVQITCNEFKVIDAVWRYNGRSIYPAGSCMGNDYLRCVADKLNEIERTFGYEMPDKDAWITRLKAVSLSVSEVPQSGI